jgi:Ca2+-binding RTX toxin-like protein
VGAEPTSSSGIFLFGGAGNDESIQGGGANDILFGDDGVVVFIDFGSLPFASTFENRLGNEIVSNDRLIGDGDWDPNDPYTDTNNASHHDEDPRTLDVIMTEVNGTTDGNDYVVGGEGDDIALGGAKNDFIYGDFDPTDPPDGPIPADVDILIGDGGRIEFNARERDNIRSLVGADASEVGVDHIYGNGGTDTIFGSGDGDFLYGRMDSIYNSNPALQEEPCRRRTQFVTMTSSSVMMVRSITKQEPASSLPSKPTSVWMPWPSVVPMKHTATSTTTSSLAVLLVTS